MINYSQNDFALQVKNLSEKFKFYDKTNIRLMYEFCEFDVRKTFKVLSMVQEMPVPTSLIETIVKKPQSSEAILQELEEYYDKKYGNMEILHNYHNQNQQEDKKQEQNKFNFFELIPKDVCISIMMYLDPQSLCSVSVTCSQFLRLSQTQSLKDYYRILCMVLFKNDIPSLPSTNRFQGVREYVLNHPLQFSQNSRNAVINNLRYYVWKSQTSSFKLQKSYYLSFGSYRNLFYQCPRPHLNGYYLCKHKYVKVGEKTYKHSFTPIHVIYHYRYLRFMQDGSILYHVVPKKIKDSEVGQVLSNSCLQNSQQDRGVMIGQYMQYKNKLYIKTFKTNSIFSYEFQIQNTYGKIGQFLSVLNYTLEMVDENQILQTLYEAKPHRQPLVFQYFRNSSIQSQNSPPIRACSL